MDDPYDYPTSRIEHIAVNLALVSISRSSFLDYIHPVVSQVSLHMPVDVLSLMHKSAPQAKRGFLQHNVQ